jgi:hypothetical protein
MAHNPEFCEFSEGRGQLLIALPRMVPEFLSRTNNMRRGTTEHHQSAVWAKLPLCGLPPPAVVSVPLFKQKSEEQKVTYPARYKWNGEQALNLFQEKEKLIMQNLLGTMELGYITITFRGEKYSVRQNDESRIHNYRMDNMEGQHNIRPPPFRE